MRHILFTIKFPGKVNVGTYISESENLLFAHQIADAITIKNVYDELICFSIPPLNCHFKGKV